MNKKELIDSVAERADCTKKQAAKVIEALVNVTTETLRNGEAVKLAGFGNMQAVERKARVGRNPKNPHETIKIPACKGIAFKMSKKFKEEINS